MRPEYTINPERRALYRRQGFWGDATLADYWHQSVRAVPDRTCVVDSQGGRYTYAQLDKKAQRLAGWMHTIGVGRTLNVVMMKVRHTEGKPILSL